MSQSRPTLSSSSRECSVVDGVRQIQRIAVRNAEVGGIPINRALPTRERRLVFSRSRWTDGIQRHLARHGCGAASAHRAANVHLDDRG